MMKKALIVASTSGFTKGFLLHDMHMLQKMSFEVHCAANASKMVTFKAEEVFAANGVTFHQVDFSSSSPISRNSLMAFKQIKDLLKEHSFSLIHCHTPIVGAIVRKAASSYRKKGCKVIYTTHGLAFPKGSGFKSKLAYGGIEWLCSWVSDAIITINMEDYYVMKKMGCKNVYHINGIGVDTEKFHQVTIDRDAYRKEIGVGKDDVVVLSVGELSTRKNHQVIVKALAQLEDARYVYVICGKAMVGQGTADMLKELANQLHVRLILLGFRSDIPEITHCADIAAIPSIREGLGLAGVEALASAVPVVGSNVQGIKDYVDDGITGYLCSPMDVSAFAEKISLLSDPDMRSSMRDVCVQKAEKFRTDISWRQMEEIYNEILS